METALFDQIGANPIKTVIMDGAQYARNNGCDFIVALGGGSVMDASFIRMAQALGMKDASKPEDFITLLVKLHEDCSVADLKMSDYGFTPDEFDTLARNVRELWADSSPPIPVR